MIIKLVGACHAYAAGDPISTINKLSDFIFSLIRAIGLILLGLGIMQVTVLSFIIILTVYGRFFRLYLYTAIAPIPLSTFAGQPTQSIGVSFLKSYTEVNRLAVLAQILSQML